MHHLHPNIMAPRVQASDTKLFPRFLQPRATASIGNRTNFRARFADTVIMFVPDLLAEAEVNLASREGVCRVIDRLVDVARATDYHG